MRPARADRGRAARRSPGPAAGTALRSGRAPAARRREVEVLRRRGQRQPADARLNYTSHIPCNGVEEPKSVESYGLGIQAVFETPGGRLLGFGSEPSDLSTAGAARALAKARQAAVADPEFVSLPARPREPRGAGRLSRSRAHGRVRRAAGRGRLDDRERGAADLRDLLAPGRARRQRRGAASARAHRRRRRDDAAGADRDRLLAHAGRADGRVDADQRVRHRDGRGARAPRAPDRRPRRGWTTSRTRPARRRPRRRSTRWAASALPPGATRSCSAGSRWPTS